MLVLHISESQSFAGGFLYFEIFPGTNMLSHTIYSVPQLGLFFGFVWLVFVVAVTCFAPNILLKVLL